MREPTIPGWARNRHLRLFCILSLTTNNYKFAKSGVFVGLKNELYEKHIIL